MKKVLALSLLFLFAGSVYTYAQDTPNRQGYQEGSAEESARMMTQKMMELVPDISKEQYSKLYDVNLKYIVDASALSTHPGTSDEKVQLNNELRKQREIAVKAILTEDQFARLDEGMKQVPKRP